MKWIISLFCFGLVCSCVLFLASSVRHRHYSHPPTVADEKYTIGMESAKDAEDASRRMQFRNLYLGKDATGRKVRLADELPVMDRSGTVQYQ